MLNLLLVLGLALPPLAAYNQGNRLYAQKDYARAALAYEQALAAGPSARVHYNLANALFKTGRIGQAVLHYRRAHYLDPRDADVNANLAFARSYRVDKLPGAQSPLARLLDEMFHRLSHREAALWAAVSFALAALSLAAWIVARGRAFLGAVALFGAGAAFCFITQLSWAGEIASQPAVVVVPEAGAWSGPSEELKQILLLHDGTEVRIRETRGEFVLVQLAGGSGGWTRKDALERIY